MQPEALKGLYVLAWVARGVLGLVGGLGLVRYRRLAPELRYLVGLVWFGLLLEATGELLRHWHLPNLMLSPVDATGEVWLLSLVYDRALQSARFSRWRPWVAGGFVLYAAASCGLAPEMARFKPGVMVLECLLVLGMVRLYFRKLLTELRTPEPTRDPMFWVSAGLLVYFMGKLLVALCSNYALTHYSWELNMWMWAGVNGLAVALYLCYGRALWIRPQR